MILLRMSTSPSALQTFAADLFQKYSAKSLGKSGDNDVIHLAMIPKNARRTVTFEESENTRVTYRFQLALTSADSHLTEAMQIHKKTSPAPQTTSYPAVDNICSQLDARLWKKVSRGLGRVSLPGCETTWPLSLLEEPTRSRIDYWSLKSSISKHVIEINISGSYKSIIPKQTKLKPNNQTYKWRIG